MSIEKVAKEALARGFKRSSPCVILPRPIVLLTVPIIIMFRAWKKIFSRMFLGNTLSANCARAMERSSNGRRGRTGVRSLLSGLCIPPPR